MSNKNQWIVASVVCVVLSGFIYVNSHTEKVMSAMANYYFKKNDTVNAMKYYENAFELGYQDVKARDTYINLIINSPLNTDNQEKLVKFLKLNVDDGANYKAEYFLADIKRDVAKKYPDNYITQTAFNQKVMRWSEVPVTYSFVNQEIAPEYYVKEIENAFSEWEKATDHKILFSQSDINPNILIRFNTDNPADDEDKKYVVAYTAPQVQGDKLKVMTIDFYTKAPDGEAYSENQVYNTALHEIVHALGFMGHSDYKKNIMYLTRNNKDVSEDARANLTEADISTVKLLYSIKPDITNSSKPVGEYIPFIVMGSQKEVTNAKIKEAKTYIQKAPNLPSGYMDLAEGYVAAKDYRKAVKYLEKALTLAETNDVIEMIYYNLALTHFYMNDYEKSKDYIQKASQIKDSEEHHHLLAEIYLAQGLDTRAINEYEKLIRINPENIEYTIALANIYVRQFKYISARKVLKDYIKNNPKDRNNLRFAPYGIIKLGL